MGNKLKVKLGENIDKILCVLLLVCAIFGNGIPIGEVKIIWINLTLYRLGIPIITMYYLLKRCKERAIKEYFSNKIYIIGMAIMVFWALYGTVLIFISPYSELVTGFKEILNIVLGGMLIYSLTECCQGEKMVGFCMKMIKYIILLLVLFGMIELMTGIHLRTSRYAGDYSGMSILNLLLRGVSQGTLFPVTTIFYGTNDFSAFLAIFFPVLFVEKESKYKILNYLLMAVTVFLISINDANICLIALFVMAIMAIIVTKFEKYFLGTGGIVFLIQFWLTKIVSSIVLSIQGKIYAIFSTQTVQPEVEVGNEISSMQENITGTIQESVQEIVQETIPTVEGNHIDGNMSTQEAILSQLNSASEQTGSLYQRILLMSDAFKMWFDSHFLGMGPASYTSYVQTVGGKSKYINPHNWWLEILSQYGIFVFLVYVFFLAYMWLTCLKRYIEEKDSLILKYVCILFLYVICSIAPSSFINYSYQWIIVAMGMIIMNSVKQKSDLA